MALCFHLPMLMPCWILPISSIAFGLLNSFKCYCISSLLYLLLHVDNFIHVIMWFSFSSMPNLFHTCNCTCVVDFIREHSKSNHEQYNSFTFIISSLIINTFKKRLSSLIYGHISSICIAQLHVLLNHQPKTTIHPCENDLFIFLNLFFGIQSCSQISFMEMVPPVWN
jgi:hypothetical protein